MNAKRGQPPKGAKALSSGIKIRLSPADRKRLDSAAKAKKKGPSSLARELVLDALKKIER
jgi:hypothetical protein